MALNNDKLNFFIFQINKNIKNKTLKIHFQMIFNKKMILTNLYLFDRMSRDIKQ